jgi:hypothetical protein
MKICSSAWESGSNPIARTVALGAACVLFLATPVAALAPGGHTIAGPGKTTGSNTIYIQDPAPNLCVTVEYISGSPTICKIFDNGSQNVLTDVTASPGQDQSTCTSGKAYNITCFCTGSPPCVANWRVDSKR